LHADAVELRFARDQAIRLLSNPYKFASEDPGFFCGLGGLGGVTLASSRCLEYGLFGFVFDDLEGCDIASELASILSDQLIAFPYLDGSQRMSRSVVGECRFADLDLGVWFEENRFDGLHVADCWTLELAEGQDYAAERSAEDFTSRSQTLVDVNEYQSWGFNRSKVERS